MRRCRARVPDQRLVSTQPGTRGTIPACRTATPESTLPPETVTLACPRQVVPHLLLHPVSDVREAATRVTERKVLHPAAQDGIDTRNHLCRGPRPITSKDLLERLQQRREKRLSAPATDWGENCMQRRDGLGGVVPNTSRRRDQILNPTGPFVRVPRRFESSVSVTASAQGVSSGVTRRFVWTRSRQ
jgi:hypothetical protein